MQERGLVSDTAENIGQTTRMAVEFEASAPDVRRDRAQLVVLKGSKGRVERSPREELSTRNMNQVISYAKF